MKAASGLAIAATMFVSSGVIAGQLSAMVLKPMTSRASDEVRIERTACQFARTDQGSRSAQFNAGTCGIQDGALTFVLLDNQRRPVGAERRFELREIRSVSLQSRLLKEQLQLPVGDSVIALNILSDDGQRKSRERALAFFSALREAGVRPANGHRMVDEYPTGASTR